MTSFVRSSRFYLGLGAATSLLALLSSFVDLGVAFSSVAIFTWLFAGPGVAILPALRRFGAQTQVILASLTGLVLMLALTTAEAWFDMWHPTLTLVGLSLVTLLSAMAQLFLKLKRRESVEGELDDGEVAAPGVLRRAREAIITPSRVLLTIALGAVIGCLPLLATTKATIFGLMLSGPVGYTLLGAIAVVLAVSARAIYKRDIRTIVYGLFVTILVFRLPTAFASELPIYGWTFKHLGVVDYVLKYHHLANGIDVYNAWPALFTFMAWLVHTTGLSYLTMASFWILAMHLLQAPVVYLLARELNANKVTAITAAFLGEIFNWIAQDYFSPQSIDFLLGTLFLVLVLRSRRAPGLIWWTLPLFMVITVTHQLTPYWLLIIMGTLSVFKFIKPRWFFLLPSAFAAGWLFLNYKSVARYGLFSGFDPLANAARPSYGVGSMGYSLVENTMRAIALCIWITSFLFLLHRYVQIRRSGEDKASKKALKKEYFWLPVIFLGAPFVLLGGQSYGGEAIFRVLLYSLPVCAVIIAIGLNRIFEGRSAVRRGSKFGARFAAVIIVIIGLMSLHAVYGSWYNQVISKASYDTEIQLSETLPSDAVQLAFSPPGPGRANADYVRFAKKNLFFDPSLADIDPNTLLDQSFKNPKVEQDLTAYLQGQNKPVVLVWVKGMDSFSAYYGLYPQGAFPRLITQLKADPNWAVKQDTDQVKVFELKGTSTS